MGGARGLCVHPIKFVRLICQMGTSAVQGAPEKAVKSIQIELSTSEKQLIHSLLNIVRPSKIDWSLPSDFTFNPRLLADLEILKNIEMPFNI